MNTQTKNAISRAYFKKGAYLVNAHGLLASPNNIQKTVPKNTVIYFLANPGYCLNILTTLGIQNEFFTNKQKLYNFLYRAGNAVNKKRNKNIAHVHDINTRIKIPGDKYLDMNLNIIPNKEWPTMGYIKQLPTKTSNKIPNFTNVVPVPSGRYRLSTLLQNRFSNGGVIIISACRAIPINTKHRFEEPGLEKTQPARGTAWTNAITKGEGLYKRRIRGRSARPPIALAPIKPKTVKSRKFPAETLRKIRQAVTAGGKNVLNILRGLKVPANLPSRLPRELGFLKKQQRLARLSNNRYMKLRSGVRLKK
jgi:hypothetical protein